MTNPTSDPTAIRPCPFCGSNDIITTCADGPEWNVMCRKCCSSSHWDQTEDGAIAAWNRRAPKQAEGERSCDGCRLDIDPMPVCFTCKRYRFLTDNYTPAAKGGEAAT